MSENYSALEVASAAAKRFIRELPDRKVFPTQVSRERVRAFAPDLPTAGLSESTVVEMLLALAEDGLVATPGPRFFGYVTGGALPATVSASWLAAAWDQIPSDYRLSPFASRLEEITGEWLVDLLKLPASASVNYVTGTTMGNFVGLAAARETILRRMNWNVQAHGLMGAPPIRIIVGEEAHPTIFKALGMLGLGRETAIRVPTDAQGRIRPDEMPTLGPDCIVCLQAGNVNSGAFDPLKEIATSARAADAWTHIDGAFGLVAAASPKYAPLLAGHDLADSWALDGHKWLNTPYDCGVAICRWPNAVRDAFAYEAAYLEEGEAGARNMVPELSRRARSIEMFAALASLGRDGLGDLVERCCAHARRFADGLAALGYEVLNDVVLNQCVAAIGTREDVQAIFEHVQDSGEAWMSTTEWRGRFGLRISVASWATTTADVDRTLVAIARATDAVNARRK